jgi:hypothetical protein
MTQNIERYPGPMTKIKSSIDAPDFKSPSRHVIGSILEYVSFGVTPRVA